jgi:hypothetical protein
VIWWFSQRLKELVDIDSQLLYDISQECGFDIVNDLTSFPCHLTPEGKLEAVKAIADELGYRVHKKEPKKTKDKSISFQITN